MSDQSSVVETKTDIARKMLESGHSVGEIAKELGTKSPAWIYAMKKKIKSEGKIKVAPAAKPGRKPTGQGAGSGSKTGFYFVSPDFPVAFASQSVGQKYLGEKAQLTKVAVLLS